MGYGLDKLSTEVVVEILGYLSYVDLLQCARISRKLYTVISDTASLQYTIELGMAGYEIGDTSINVVQRLNALRRARRTWRHPELKHTQTIRVPSHDWFEAKAHKDIISGRIPDDPSRLDVMYLSSTVPDGERLKQLQFDVRFDALYIDPGQDLVVLAALAITPDAAGLRPSPRLYLKSLNDQKPHPRAKQSFIDLASYGFPAVSFVRRVKIQVSGDYLALTIHKSLAVEAILVWHWPSGAILAALRSSSEVTYLTAFCSADGHLLVNRHYPHAANGFGIHVYALARDAAEEGPTLLATFELPRLNWDFSSWLSASFFPGYGKCTQLAGAGAAGRAGSVPGQVLVQLRIDLQVALYTPLATFLAPRVLRARARGGGPLRIAWAAWGPHACRLVHEEVECAVLCGYKAVYSDYALDFCPVTDGAGDDAVVTAETVVKSSVFAEPVVTRLPYRRVELPFSRPLARNQMYLFFEDVDGPKIVRATCDEFILIPTSLDIYALEPKDGGDSEVPPASLAAPRTHRVEQK